VPSVTVTVVVVNKDDPQIADTLERLSHIDLTLKPEIVVVDASAGRFEAIRRSHPEVIWTDYRHERGKPRSIAEQRNIGVRQAHGDVVVFLDASCVPTPEWLDHLLAPILREGERITVGSVETRGRKSVHDVAAPHGGGGTYLTECANMNVAFHRDVFQRIGEFDESLGFAEDVDFAWRAIDAGFAIRYVPTAVVAHNWGSTSEELRRALRYGIGRVRLYRKHKSRRRNLLGFDFFIVAYAIYVVLLPLALVFPEYLLVLVIPVVRNRRTKPLLTTAYHLVYGAGVAAELLHIRLVSAQRTYDEHAPS
jgi:GT2 family glycosyltransferase